MFWFISFLVCVAVALPLTFSRLAPFATYEDEYFRLNENTLKNGNSTKFANGARRVLAAVLLFTVIFSKFIFYIFYQYFFAILIFILFGLKCDFPCFLLVILSTISHLHIYIFQNLKLPLRIYLFVNKIQNE